MNYEGQDPIHTTYPEDSPENFSFPPDKPGAEAISPESGEAHSNRYVEAGYETGDIVEYTWADGQKEIMTIDIGDHGAWLIKHEGAAYARANKNESTNPDKCRPYEYTSPIRAMRAYQQIMLSPDLNSKEKLFELFDVLQRSNVAPSRVGLHNYGGDIYSWYQIKELVDRVVSGQAKSNYLTRDYGLREKVQSWINVRMDKRIVMDASGYERMKQEIAKYQEERSEKDKHVAEKIQLILKMSGGDNVTIKNKTYRKITDGLFLAEQGDQSHDRTVAQETKDMEDLIKLINSPYIEADDIQIVVNAERGQAVVQESKEKLRQIDGDFKKILGDIFPLWLTSKDRALNHIQKSEIQQNGFGDCYLLAAINSIKKTNPTLYYETLARTISKLPNNAWKVQFQGHRDTEVIITEQDLAQWQSQGARADKADIILERAYASLKSRLKRGTAGQTMVVDYKNKMEFEGGFGHRALNDILGSEVAAKFKIADYQDDGYTSLAENGYAETARNFFANQYSKNPEKYIVTANSPHHNRGVKSSDEKYVRINGQKMYFKHAYSVVDVKDNFVHIENPHDTGKDFWMSMDSFLNFFAQLSYVEVKAKYEQI